MKGKWDHVYGGVAVVEIPGIQGAKGPEGPKGERGEVGPRGPQGVRGSRGPQGIPGPQGERGPVGDPFLYEDFTKEQLARLEGPRGPTGERGPRGYPFTYNDFTSWQLKALTGPRGPQGERGERGYTGPQGERGEVGPQGPRGPLGYRGPQGEVGPQGERGFKGDTGERGPQGVVGPRGPQGEVGPQGKQGLKGDTGEVGPRGPKGDKGDIGKTGPRGPQGEVGPRGPRGEVGPQGERGFKGDQGTPFLYKDFTSDQLEKLRGPKGAQGEQGPRGFKGDTGERGPQGVVGPRGPKGDKGEKGDTLDPTKLTPEQLALVKGPKGDTGPRGEQGPVGPRGAKGDTGPAGTTTWSGIADKPSYFPPSGHVHSTRQIVDLSQTLEPIKSQVVAAEASVKAAEAKACSAVDTASQASTTATSALAKATEVKAAYDRGELKGDKGDRGPEGEQGPVGPRGAKGERGERGPKGDSVSPDNVKKLCVPSSGFMGKPSGYMATTFEFATPEEYGAGPVKVSLEDAHIRSVVALGDVEFKITCPEKDGPWQHGDPDNSPSAVKLIRLIGSPGNPEDIDRNPPTKIKFVPSEGVIYPKGLKWAPGQECMVLAILFFGQGAIVREVFNSETAEVSFEEALANVEASVQEIEKAIQPLSKRVTDNASVLAGHGESINALIQQRDNVDVHIRNFEKKVEANEGKLASLGALAHKDKVAKADIAVGAVHKTHLGGDVLRWENLNGVPSKFEPANHTHSCDQVLGLGTLARRSQVQHGDIAVGAVRQMDLDGDVLRWENFKGIPTTFAPAPHTHKAADISGLAAGISPSGPRGNLAGYEQYSTVEPTKALDASSPDSLYYDLDKDATLAFRKASGTDTTTKVITLHAKKTVVVKMAGDAEWVSGEAPKWGSAGKTLVVVAHWVAGVGKVLLSVFYNDEEK